MTPAEISRLLSAVTLRGANEADIQHAIACALADAGLAANREVDIGAAGRIDFEIPAVRLGVEVKVKGSTKEVTEQISRYAETGRYDAVLLVTTLRRHRMPATLCGVPILVCHLWGAVL